MKHFILLLLFSTILTSKIQAGIDSLYVEIKNDTVFVWSVNVWEQCAFELDYSIHFDDSFIFINQKDTAADATTCYSYHNFCMPIANLASGTYNLSLYRQSWGDSTLRYINGIQFEFTSSIVIDTANMLKEFSFDINRFKLPLNNKGVIADVDADNHLNGSFDESIVIFSGGFGLSGYSNGELWANAVMTASRIEDYQAGKVGSEPQDPFNLNYILRSSDTDFGDSWQSWKNAVELGAKFIDGDNNGIYNPIDLNENGIWNEGEDRPDLIGDMTAWSVFNDGVEAEFRRFDVSPKNIEVRQTVFGYSPNTHKELDGVYFIRYIIENKSAEQYDSVYFSHMSDPDIGEPYSDLVGCDTTLKVGFGYDKGLDDVSGNSPALITAILQRPLVYIVGETFTDNNNNGIFDIGIDTPLDTANINNGKYFPEQKIVGAKNQEITSFMQYMHSHPTMGDPNDKVEMRNYQLGLTKIGGIINPCEWEYGEVFGFDCNGVDPNFMYSGNPVTNEGWINTTDIDQRMMLNTGPFTLKPNEPIEIIVTYVVGRGNTSLESVDVTKNIAKDAIGFYSTNFNYVPVGIKDKPQSQLPTEYSLLQNYPNPFNPSTTIRYDIGETRQETQIVKLIVYNMLGQEIATLVNKKQKAGNYEVNFDASDLSSGIYYYQLISGSTAKTKKMVLLK